MSAGGPSMDPSERRRFPRADLVFRVRYRSIRSAIPAPDAGQLSRAEGRDISLGGVSFRRTDEIQAGEVLHMSFYFDELPGEISAVGRIVRIWDEPGEQLVAVRFTVIDPDDCSILATYIRQFELQSEP
ncbi:PilZ domain-containing protein [Leptonema illini]|nr:PilZ domain-containing protein [Leptonema illini]